MGCVASCVLLDGARIGVFAFVRFVEIPFLLFPPHWGKKTVF